MSRIILLNKPYDVLCQFSPDGSHDTLKSFIPVPGFYVAGRLDTDSEGLLVLTDNGALQARIADPRHKLAKTYLVQVEGEPDEAALAQLRGRLDLGDFLTQPCEARRSDEPEWLWPRVPPIRERKSIPTAWIEVRLKEGKNRQVRRMTAKVGHPTLRLIRWAIGDWTLAGLAPGEWRWQEVPDAPAPTRRDAPPPPRRSPRRPAAAGNNPPRKPARRRP